MGSYSDILLGGALGDSLGAEIEFLSHEEIVQRYGSGGLQTLIPAYGKIGAITDEYNTSGFRG